MCSNPEWSLELADSHRLERVSFDSFLLEKLFGRIRVIHLFLLIIIVIAGLHRGGEPACRLVVVIIFVVCEVMGVQVEFLQFPLIRDGIWARLVSILVLNIVAPNGHLII